MAPDLYLYLVGLVMGAASLPWAPQDRNPILHVGMWAALWPIFLLLAAWGAAKRFVSTWARYLRSSG